MRRFARAFVVGLAVLGAAASIVRSQPPPEVSEWRVEGVHNRDGSYTGTARLTVEDLDVSMTFEGATASGKRLGWTGHGRIVAGSIKLKIEPDSAGVTGALKGATEGTKGRAEYVLTVEKSISGYWSFPGKKGSKKAGPGGTETLSLRKGKAILPPPSNLPPPRLPADALPVPLVTQPDEYSCGAASLQSILYYYRLSDGDLHSLYRPLKTSAANGTEPPEIVAFAQKKGLTASFDKGKKVGLDDLRDALGRRDPVMMVIQAWRETTTPWRETTDAAHWVVLVGMDAHYAYFMDPWAHFGYGYIPLDELLDRWHCEEETPSGKLVDMPHEAIFFHGLATARKDQLVRIQ